MLVKEDGFLLAGGLGDKMRFIRGRSGKQKQKQDLDSPKGRSQWTVENMDIDDVSGGFSPFQLLPILRSNHYHDEGVLIWLRGQLNSQSRSPFVSSFICF